MKTRESGMPDEGMWESFFDPVRILSDLGLNPSCGNVVEFGCGYGTFTMPAARIVRGTVYALDIEPAMVAATRARAERERLANVEVVLRDFVADGTGLECGSADYAMLFNILHCESPEILLREAYRVLHVNGKLGVIHWRSDLTTPRGPSLKIRPTPQMCVEWSESVGFTCSDSGVIQFPPYHFGIVFTKSRLGSSN